MVSAAKKKKNNALQLPVISIDLHYLTQLSAPETAHALGFECAGTLHAAQLHKKFLMPEVLLSASSGVSFLWSLRLFFP